MMSGDDIDMSEWAIPYNELTFTKKILDGGPTGQDIYFGRWHGDVIIHNFRSEERYVYPLYDWLWLWPVSIYVNSNSPFLFVDSPL